MKTVIYKYVSMYYVFWVKKMNGRPVNKNLAEKPLMIRFTKLQHKKLREISEKQDTSIASIVRLAVGIFLERNEKC